MAYNKRLFEMLADEIKEYNNNAGISTSDSHTAQDIISGKYQKEYEKLQEQQRQLQMQRQQEELQKNQVRAKQLAQETMEKQQSSSNTNQIGSTFRSIVNKSQSNSNDEQIDAKKISKRILDNDLYYKIRNPTLKGLGDAIQTVADGITKEAYSTIEDFTGFLDNISTGVLSGIKKSADYLWNAGQSNIKNSTYNILNEQQIEKAKQNGIIENDYDYYKEMIPEDSPIRMLSNEANNLKKQLNEKSKETDNFINNAINNNVEGASNPISKKLNELAPSIGQMIPGMVGGGTPYMFTSAAGSYYDDALDRGMDEDKALTYATIMGGIEGITESVQFGKIFKAGSNITTGSIKSALKEYGFNIADNFVQEAVTEPLSEITAQTVGGTADWSNMGSRMLKSGIDGAIVAVIVNGASAGIGSAQSLKTKMVNGEQVTQEELKQVVKDVQASGKVDVESIAKEEFQAQVDKIKQEANQTTQTEENIPPINKEQSIQDDIAPIDQNVQNNAQIEGLQNAIQEKQNQLENSEDEKAKQIINESINQLQTELNEETSKPISQTQGVENQKENYKYEKSENEKIDTFRKDASKYLDNSNETQKLVDTVEKVISDKNYSIRLDDTIINENGKLVNAQIKTLEDGTTELTINPNANNVAEFLLTHEITHSIETTEMKNLVMDYASKNNEFNQSLETLKEAYGTEEVSDEVLADVSAQLFGNQEFINELSTKKPNIFKKIYNKIIELANKITGNSKESLFIKDLKNKWQEAYSNKNEKLDNTKYKIETDEKNRNYVKADRQVIFGNDYLEWEKQVENYINEKIRNRQDVNVLTDDGEVLTITEDTAGKAKFRNEIIDKNGNKRRLNKKEFLSKLTAETHIDELAQISKQSNKTIVPDYKNHSFAKDGFNYRTAYFEDFDGQYYQITMSVGKNGDINTIYNIGKMNKKNRSTSSLVAQRPSNNNVTSNEENTSNNRTTDSSNGLGLQLPVPDNTSSSNNSITSSNEGVNTNKYSTQESQNNAGNQAKYSRTPDIPQWQQWLEENFKASGTRTKFEDILAPVQNKVQEEVKKTVQDIVAPLQETIQDMSEQIDSLVDEIAPVKNINNTDSTETTNNTMKESALDYIQSSFDISKEEAENLYDKIINTKNYNVKDVYNILQDLQNQENVTAWNNEDLENISENVFNDVAKSEENLKENNYNDFLDNIGYAESLETQEEPYNYYDFINNNKIKFNEEEKNIIQDLEEKLDINNKQAKNIYDKLAKKKFLIKSDVYDLLAQYKSLGEEDITTQEVKALINNTQIDTSNVSDFYKKLSTKYPFIFDNNITQPKQQMEEITKFQNEDLRADFYKYDDKKIRAYSEQLFDKIKSIKEEKQKEDVMNFISGLDYKDDVIDSYNKKTSSTKNNRQSTLDYIVEKRTKEKVSFKEVKDTVAQRIINQGHYVDKLSEKTKNPQLKYSYDRYLRSLSEAQYSIGEKQTDNKGNVVGKSITEIFKPAIKSGKYKEFNDYLLNRHNIDRMAMDKAVYGNEFTANDSKDIVFNYEKQYPEFKEWAEDVYKYNKNALKNKMEAGFISKDTYENFLAMYGNYVPTFRDIVEPNLEKIDSSQAGFSPLKKATGGDYDILVVDEAMAEQVVEEKRALRLNETLKQLYYSLGEESKVINDMPMDDPIATSLLMSDTNNFMNIDENGEVTALFFEDGEITQFHINENLYKAFDNKNTWSGKIQNNKVANKLLKPLEKITSFRRDLLTTYSIGFSMNNPIKDLQEAVFNTKYSTGRFAVNYGRALFEIATKGDHYQNYLANGGGANTYFEYDTGLKKQNKFVKAITTPIRAINTLNEVLERAPRLAEYISTMQKTGDINEAMYNAAELTTNFKRGGDITKAFNKYGFNFLNASVQGLDKMYRNLTGQNGWKGYASLITKATLFAIAPSLINYLVYQDDDDYEDLPEYVTNKYWLFKTNDNKFIRIPQGRVTSVLGDAATSILKVAQGKSNIETEFKEFLSNSIEQVAPNNPISNNIVSPYLQAKSNTSWYGEDIVSSRLSKLPNVEQYDERTDDFSKWLGEKLNVSPKKINYLLDQYGGGISDILLPMGTPYAENSILEEKFTTDSVMKNKNVSLFYDTLEDLEKNKNSKYATDTDELKYKYMSSVNKDVADLYSQKRDIENSDMTDEEKKEAARAVQKKINSTVKDALLNYKNVGQQSNYTSVGETEYYKNSKGKWEEIDDTKVAELSQLKLTDEQKNDYFKVKEATDKIDKKYKTSDLISDEQRTQYSNSKRVEIANKIISSNLDDNSKAHLYNSYYSSDKDIQTVVDLGIDVDNYLKIKAANITADKDKNGKTISNSKKNKTVKFVQSLNISANQKAVLINLEGYTDYNSQVVSYVDGLHISQSKKNVILRSMGFKVNNDKVTW